MGNKILTEEELQDICVRRVLKPLGVNWETVDKIINSHRELFKANAALSFKNMNYKNGLEAIKKDVHPEGWTRTLVDKALEETK